MKKALLFAGIGLAGFGVYRYFKYQVDLALNYEYKIKDFKIDKVEGNNVTISTTVSIKNKSNFEITINEYDLSFYFKNILFANTKSKAPLKILPETTFELRAQGVIDFSKAKVSVIPFVQDVLNRKPIDIQISGFVKVIFLRIPTTISFDKETINYSTDLLKEYNLDKGFEKLKTKYPKLFSFLKN